MSENNKKDVKKPLYLKVTQPEKFEKLASTTIETTQRLAKRINKLFQSTFVDYHGAAVYCTAGNGNAGPNNQFMVELHFKPIPVGSVPVDESRVRAFKPIDEKQGDDIVSGLKSIYGAYRSTAKFQMTEEASQILSEFLLPGVNVDPFKPSTYDQIKSEYVDQQIYGQAPIMIKIGFVDLTRLVKKIYGSKNEDGKRVDYGLIPYGPVAPNMTGTMMQSNANWRVVIMQIETEKTFDLATEFGIIPAANGGIGPVVTGTV